MRPVVAKARRRGKRVSKPYGEQTPEERLKSLDRLQNILGHADWSEMYLRAADDVGQMQWQMDNAHDWDTFVAARAVKTYIQDHLLKLRERVKEEKEELETELAMGEQPPPDDEF